MASEARHRARADDRHGAQRRLQVCGNQVTATWRWLPRPGRPATRPTTRSSRRLIVSPRVPRTTRGFSGSDTRSAFPAGGTAKLSQHAVNDVARPEPDLRAASSPHVVRPRPRVWDTMLVEVAQRPSSAGVVGGDDRSVELIVLLGSVAVVVAMHRVHRRGRGMGARSVCGASTSGACRAVPCNIARLSVTGSSGVPRTSATTWEPSPAPVPR
jgi:hypothetical protein